MPAAIGGEIVQHSVQFSLFVWNTNLSFSHFPFEMNIRSKRMFITTPVK